MVDPVQPRWSLWRVLRKCLWGTLKWSLLAVALYFCIIAIGLIPVNNGFRSPPDVEDSVEILFVSNPVHADVVMPVRTDVVDWTEQIPRSCFYGDVSTATHVAVGWGDKGFFINTPTWGDLKFSTAANALLMPSDCCLHVTMTRKDFLADARAVRISVEQYRQLVEYVQASFKLDSSGSSRQIGKAAYGYNDAFFEAHGNYHCLNTCNSWIGAAMRAAGIRAGWLTPLPKTPFLYL